MTATTLIQTTRLLLKPFSLVDADDVFAYASNPNVARFTSWVTHRTVADSEDFIRMVLGRGQEEHTWAIRVRPDPRAVGAIEFSLESETEAEFHYVLAEEHWNRGLMTEAARAVLDWGCKRYPTLRHIRTRAFAENLASQRVMEKCGLRFEGTRMIASEKLGREVEHCEYGVVIRDGGADSR